MLLSPAFAYCATVALALVIAVATLMPPGFVPIRPPGSDKLHHLLGFAALAFPVALAQPRQLILVLPAIFCFGAAIELVQPQFGRSAEVADLVADAVGVVIGTGMGLAVRTFLMRQTVRHPVG